MLVYQRISIYSVDSIPRIPTHHYKFPWNHHKPRIFSKVFSTRALAAPPGVRWIILSPAALALFATVSATLRSARAGIQVENGMICRLVGGLELACVPWICLRGSQKINTHTYTYIYIEIDSSNLGFLIRKIEHNLKQTEVSHLFRALQVTLKRAWEIQVRLAPENGTDLWNSRRYLPNLTVALEVLNTQLMDIYGYFCY